MSGELVSAYWAGKDLERVVERLEQFVAETSARIRRLEAEHNLDKRFLETEGAAELVIEVTNKVTLERDSEKRDLYAAILANTARLDADRSFYPTALKLLDAVEPVHVEILRELLQEKEERKAPGGEQETSTKNLALSLHLGELEDMRVGGLSEEVPEFFSTEIKGVAAWDQARGKVASYGGPRARSLIDAVQRWDEEIHDHVLYLAKEGLVVDPASARWTSINHLRVRLVEWLSEPEG